MKLTKGLTQEGYQCQSTTGVGPKVNTVMIASRIPFKVVRLEELVAQDYPRILMAKFEKFSVAGVYFAQKEEKRTLFDYLMKHGVRYLGDKGLVTGDFNTGRAYLDEPGKSFACIDAFEHLEKHGLVDSWRSRNPGKRESSWFSSKPHMNGFRIDHVFSTLAMDRAITKVYYDHAPRLEKDSDHSALLTEFDV